MYCSSRAVCFGIWCILYKHTYNSCKNSQKPVSQHHNQLIICKEVRNIRSFSMFWKRGFITLPWTGIPETTRLNFIAVRRAKSKTNMLLNLLSRSTPGGSQSDAQSTRCSLYPNPFHRTTACKKGTLSDFEEKWSDIPNLLFEAWEIIAKTKQG